MSWNEPLNFYTVPVCRTGTHTPSQKPGSCYLVTRMNKTNRRKTAQNAHKTSRSPKKAPPTPYSTFQVTLELSLDDPLTLKDMTDRLNTADRDLREALSNDLDVQTELKVLKVVIAVPSIFVRHVTMNLDNEKMHKPIWELYTEDPDAPDSEPNRIEIQESVALDLIKRGVTRIDDLDAIVSQNSAIE